MAKKKFLERRACQVEGKTQSTAGKPPYVRRRATSEAVFKKLSSSKLEITKTMKLWRGMSHMHATHSRCKFSYLWTCIWNYYLTSAASKQRKPANVPALGIPRNERANYCKKFYESRSVLGEAGAKVVGGEKSPEFKIAPRNLELTPAQKYAAMNLHEALTSLWAMNELETADDVKGIARRLLYKLWIIIRQLANVITCNKKIAVCVRTLLLHWII